MKEIFVKCQGTSEWRHVAKILIKHKIQLWRYRGRVFRIVTTFYVSENKTSVEHQTTADQGTMRDVFEFLKQKNLPNKRVQENARAKLAKLKFRNDQAYSRIIFSITDAEKKLQKDVGEIDELKKLKLEAGKIYNQAKLMLESDGKNMTVKDFSEATELIKEEEENT